MTFGEKLKELRLARGLTQPQVVESTGVGLQTLKDYEGNRRSPSLEIAQKLAAALGVGCEAFNGCEFRHAGQSPAKLPTGPARRRTGRKMPAHPRKSPGKG